MFCLSMLHLFDLFRTKKVNIITIIVFYLNTFTVQVIFWCNAEFTASFLQSSVSNDPSEIIIICWFAAQETLIIIINVENSCVA